VSIVPIRLPRALRGAGFSVLRKLVVWPLMFSVFFGAAGARAASGFSGDPVAVEKAAQSVLMLEVYNHGELIATGSGFVAFESDALVTNSHVIDGADSILARSDQGGEYVLDKVYAVDAKKDLAILGFSAPTDLSPLALGTGGVMRVEPVVAIGSPKGLLNTVSVGNVSAVFEEDGTRYIQFTAPISSGSSGGALFNNSGEVIGITTSILGDDEQTVQNLNFAIRISEAAGLWEKVDERAWIPTGDYPAFQKTAAGFPGDTQTAYGAVNDDVPLALAAVFVLFSPYIAFLKVPPFRTKPSAQPAASDWIGPLHAYADGALKRDEAYAFDVQWEDLEMDRDGYKYYTVTVREGSMPYTLYAGVSEDGSSGILFMMDISDSLWKDDAYTAILRDLGVAFIRASGGDGHGLVKNVRDFGRCLNGYKTGGKTDVDYELYGDTAYIHVQYTQSDAGYPDAIVLELYAN
jgi:S1-C subfamily serine protease